MLLNENAQTDLISVGGITIDYIFQINELPTKNMAAQILEYGTYYGGRAPNVSVILSKLGFKTGIITVAGSDFREMGYEEYLINLRIDTVGIAINKKTKTTQVYLYVDTSGHNHTYVNLGSEVIPQSIIEDYEVIWKELIKQTKMIHISSGNPDLNKKILEIRRILNLNIPVSFDIGNDIFFHNEHYLKGILNETTFLFLNEFEFKYLSNMLNLHKPKDIFEFSESVEALSIVYKNRSVKLYTKEGEYYYKPQIEYSLKDFTGTSDAYISGYIAGYLKDSEHIERMTMGQILTKYIGSKLGAQTCVPTWELLQGELENEKNAIRS